MYFPAHLNVLVSSQIRICHFSPLDLRLKLPPPDAPTLHLCGQMLELMTTEETVITFPFCNRGLYWHQRRNLHHWFNWTNCFSPQHSQPVLPNIQESDFVGQWEWLRDKSTPGRRQQSVSVWSWVGKKTTSNHGHSSVCCCVAEFTSFTVVIL